MKYQTIFPSLKKSFFIFILSFSMLIFTPPASTFAQSNDNVISGANYYVSSTGSYIDIRNNYIHHIEANVKDGNAHGIALYGTSSSAQNNLNHIVIYNNEVTTLELFCLDMKEYL